MHQALVVAVLGPSPSPALPVLSVISSPVFPRREPFYNMAATLESLLNMTSMPEPPAIMVTSPEAASDGEMKLCEALSPQLYCKKVHYSKLFKTLITSCGQKV